MYTKIQNVVNMSHNTPKSVPGKPKADIDELSWHTNNKVYIDGFAPGLEWGFKRSAVLGTGVIGDTIKNAGLDSNGTKDMDHEKNRDAGWIPSADNTNN